MHGRDQSFEFPGLVEVAVLVWRRYDYQYLRLTTEVHFVPLPKVYCRT